MSVDKMIDYAFSRHGITSIELPPGIGKTLKAIRRGYAMARRGRSVFFFSNTHAALSKALEYLLKEVLRDIHRGKKPPRIIYYAGVSRYCPFFRSAAAFETAKAWALGQGMVEPPVRAVGGLDRGFEDFRRIMGMGYICRSICPIFNMSEYPKNTVLSIPPEVYSSDGELGDLIKEVERLGYLEIYSPSISSDGYSGVCVRRRILSPRIVFRTFVLAPLSAYRFIKSISAAYYSALQRRGLRVKRPVYILDEYDSMLYRPRSFRLFYRRDLLEEHGLASKIVDDMFRCLESESSCYDPYVFLAALSAKNACEYILGSEEFKPLIADYAINSGLAPAEPMIPSREEMYRAILDRVKMEIMDISSSAGASPLDVEKLTEREISYALKIWELGYARKYRTPMLSGSSGLIYIYQRESEDIASPSRSIVNAAGVGTIFYSIEDGVLLAHTISNDVLDVGGSTAILLSATGFPWLGDVFSTLSGIQLANISVTLSSTHSEGGFRIYRIDFGGVSIDVITLRKEDLDRYINGVVLEPVELPNIFLEPETAIREYTYLVESISKDVGKSWGWERYIPAVLVVSQRKSIAYRIAKQISRKARLLTITRSGVGETPTGDPLAYIAVLGDVHAIITWYRSGFSRGIDLPREYAVPDIISVGTPYSPPTRIDIYVDGCSSSGLCIPASLPSGRMVSISSYRLDIAYSYSEFIQIVGRALRRRWQIMNEDRATYRIRITAPRVVIEKLYEYAPIWVLESYGMKAAST